MLRKEEDSSGHSPIQDLRARSSPRKAPLRRCGHEDPSQRWWSHFPGLRHTSELVSPRRWLRLKIFLFVMIGHFLWRIRGGASRKSLVVVVLVLVSRRVTFYAFLGNGYARRTHVLLCLLSESFNVFCSVISCPEMYGIGIVGSMVRFYKNVVTCCLV
ncbi:unnamed protein product [Brassica oleracea var. botrytis]